MRPGSLLNKMRYMLRWAPASIWQQLTRPSPKRGLHVIFALADHFEHSFDAQNVHDHVPRAEQLRRVQEWRRVYPDAVRQWPDSGGRPFVHTMFFPAEQHDQEVVESLADFCHEGWSELEIHLHHGVGNPDSSENTRRILSGFRDTLAALGCLSRWNGEGTPRYGFVHGNWALANSKEGDGCGVDDEMSILSDTGCYADFTLPSAPSIAQTSKINALYECGGPLNQRAPHRFGRDLQVGRAPTTFPLIFQGPLRLDFGPRANGSRKPFIENSAVAGGFAPTMRRLERWIQAGITVKGRPEWVFIKLHCHGMDPRDKDVMLGEPLRKFLRDLKEASNDGRFVTHFTTTREMVNIALAACDGKEGNPDDFRDYRLRLITNSQRQENCAAVTRHAQ